MLTLLTSAKGSHVPECVEPLQHLTNLAETVETLQHVAERPVFAIITTRGNVIEVQQLNENGNHLSCKGRCLCAVITVRVLLHQVI
jgi:hypothetical protein